MKIWIFVAKDVQFKIRKTYHRGGTTSPGRSMGKVVNKLYILRKKILRDYFILIDDVDNDLRTWFPIKNKTPLEC